MAGSSPEAIRENRTDSYPLLMVQPDNGESSDHVIDIERHGDASSSSSVSPHNHSPSFNHNEQRPSGSPQATINHSPRSTSNLPNPPSPSLSRRGEAYGRRHWSPFNTMLWISIELSFISAQIIAAIVVLTVSRHENPQTPLFAWIVGYATGCVACLPLLYWRYLHRNQAPEQVSTPLRQDSSQNNSQAEQNSYITIALTRSSDEEGQNNEPQTQNSQIIRAENPRLIALVDQFKMALDCFFAVWFVVGNVWIFGGNASAADAPNLYRLCIVFLTISCIGYAMPFILCAMICCCLPCIISILGVREDVNQMRGASEESINALPKHTFQLKRNGSSSSRDSSSSGVDEGGVVAAGTEKERVISGEDAVCCICLARYTDNDELRELPCSHFFHTDCVDKWLKINASCPLCKFEIAGSNENPSATVDSNQQEC